jgi:hypothetical protein
MLDALIGSSMTLYNDTTEVPPAVSRLSIIGGVVTYDSETGFHTLTITGTGGVPSTRQIIATTPLRANGGNSAYLSSDVTISMQSATAARDGYMTKEAMATLADAVTTSGTTHADRLARFDSDGVIKDSSVADDGENVTIPFGTYFRVVQDATLGYVFTCTDPVTGLGQWQPNTQWVIGGSNYVPIYVLMGTGLEVLEAGGGEFVTPRLGVEYRWGDLSAKVTIAGADTTKLLYSLDLTDVSKASKYYLIVIEFEVILDTTDKSALGHYVDTFTYEAAFDGDGVPTIQTIGAGYNFDLSIDHSGSPAIPTITAITPSFSGASVTLILTKPGSADNTYAQTRSRLITVKEAL